MFYGDGRGRKILATMQSLAADNAALKPAGLLEKLAADGGTFVDLDLGGLRNRLSLVDKSAFNDKIGESELAPSRRPCSSIRPFSSLVMSIEPQIIARSVVGSSLDTPKSSNNWPERMRSVMRPSCSKLSRVRFEKALICPAPRRQYQDRSKLRPPWRRYRPARPLRGVWVTITSSNFS